MAGPEKNRIKPIKKIFIIIISLFAMAFPGCRPALRQEIVDRDKALYPIRYFYPEFKDDMDPGSLVRAIVRNLEYLNRLDPNFTFSYGRHIFECRQVVETQEMFLKILSESPDSRELDRRINKSFQIFKAAGRAGSGKVLFTGYFEPTFNASLKPDERFRFPIYRKPENLLKIDLSKFSEKYAGESIIGRIEKGQVLPYYSRREIETKKVLSNKGLEIAWLKDPVDVAFLHIQGSGRLRLPDGKIISVGYMASNGRPYHSIGRYMLDKGYLDTEGSSMKDIRHYLSNNPKIVDEVLNYNPSYVFFRIREKGPFGNINVPLTAGRSIALSSSLFPKGALCFISSEKPVLNEKGGIDSWRDFSRFVINQDTGGAIKGAGRADIFWGSDSYAELAAGNMKHEGELYFLMKR